ncbi:prenyltransferase [Microbispora sp. ATCC PTA-5024]|uniref:prenyltransferase n=1 Tax=Microbispora sp. ATCC PTA-5024 TaxID=316330 RepID=UPI0003DC36F1|nr:prenyltransferase [Microbispora sp. ATCC PTA-5024]ETK31921.1 prenyltransferase-like family protein [Microbispora sp. ATCC PTA-5024]
MRRLPAVPGIITAEQVLRTAESIAAVQEDDGGVPWPEGHVDAWNHVECLMAMTVAGLRDEARRGYEWLARHQRPDGSWPMKMAGGEPVEAGGESNHAAYVAVGVWHDLLVTGDEDFARAMWPVVSRALDFVVGLQTTRGEILWERAASGEPASYALLTGSSSIHQGLRCGVLLAERLGDPQPDWELAADRLGHVLVAHPEAFADKSRFSMDWYYPVLGGAVRGPRAAQRLDLEWDVFVVPGLGVRCVSDQPWVTGAESCELVLALDAAGRRKRALAVYADMQHLRHEDGSYWTGWQFVNRRHFPHERSAYTAAAVVLAADALARATPGSGVFRDATAQEVRVTGDCGCERAHA